MKNIQLAILLAISCTILSCDDMKQGDAQSNGSTKPKEFTSAVEAANAAKQDMLQAAEQLNFGIDKEKLRASTPGTAMSSYTLNWDALLKADTAVTPQSIIGPEKEVIVPFVNGSDVVTIATLRHEGGKYAVAALGNKQTSSELDIVMRASAGLPNNKIALYEVPNLQTTIYAVSNDSAVMYFTSYRSNSLRQGMDGKSLIRILSADAREFEKQYGDEIKKGKLVR